MSLARALSHSEIERAIADLAARAGLHLRFDKVAMRVVGSLQNSLADAVQERQTILFTITAPIRQPARTVVALKILVREHSIGGEIKATVYQNEVCVRRLDGVPVRTPKVLGFIHNPDSKSSELLDLAEARLRGA